MAAVFFAAIYGGLFILIGLAARRLFVRKHSEPSIPVVDESELGAEAIVPSPPPPPGPDPDSVIVLRDLNVGEVVHCRTAAGSHYSFKLVDPEILLFELSGGKIRQKFGKKTIRVRIIGSIGPRGFILDRLVKGCPIHMFTEFEGRELTTSAVVRMLVDGHGG